MTDSNYVEWEDDMEVVSLEGWNNLTDFLDTRNVADYIDDLDDEQICPACKGSCTTNSRGYDDGEPCETCWGEGVIPQDVLDSWYE